MTTQLHPAPQRGQLPYGPDGDIAVHGPDAFGHEAIQRLRQTRAVHVLVDLKVQYFAVAGLPDAQGQGEGNNRVGVKSLRVAQYQSLPEEHPLEGPQQIQMGNIDGPALFDEK